MRWSVPRDWEGLDAYVIGGGPSLRTFDWQLVVGRRTVGCNSAFQLGPAVCEVAIFGDLPWWQNIGRHHLGTHKGQVVVSCVTERVPFPEWVHELGRYPRAGLSTDPSLLAFNGNTGALAINFALLRGAKRVLLLGFDMRAPDKLRPNWHDLRFERGNPSSYVIFARHFWALSRDLGLPDPDGRSNPTKFPGQEVVNVTDGSDLECFPKVSLAEHFGAAVVKGENK